MDNAFEKARAAYGTGAYDDATLEFLFPQLKESEDERIRKAIIGLTYIDGNELILSKCSVTRSDILAYLEKQKENIEKEYVFRPSAGTDINTAALQAIRRADEGDRLVLAFNGAYIPVRKGCSANKIVDIYDAFIEKQKEQKPLSTEETELNSIAFLEQMGYTCIPPGKEQKPAEINVKALLAADRLASAEMTGRLKERSEILENPEKYGLQKPAEWSEEDEKIIWGLTAYIPNEELERLGITRTDILMKLKSIRPQPIQLKEAYKDGFQTARHAMALAFMKYLDENRPEGKMCLSNSECEDIEKAFLVGDWEKIERYFHKYQQNPSWSEEDEKMRINILNALTPQLVYSVGKGTCTGTSTYKYYDEIRWLKSIRPSWKPSEDEKSKK